MTEAQTFLELPSFRLAEEFIGLQPLPTLHRQPSVVMGRREALLLDAPDEPLRRLLEVARSL